MRQVGYESILPSVVVLWYQTEPVDVQVSLPGRREGAQHAGFSKLTTNILRDICWSECVGVHVAGGRCKFIVHPYLSYPGTLGPIKCIENTTTCHSHTHNHTNYRYLRCLLKTARLREVPVYWGPYLRGWSIVVFSNSCTAQI